MATTAVAAVDSTVALDQIYVADNVTGLDVDHVQALAGSFRL